MMSKERPGSITLRLPLRRLQHNVGAGLRGSIPVAALYGGSIAALMLGELLLARTTSDHVFGEYSLVRQAVPMVCALGLLGYDQALTRETAARHGGVPRVDRHQARLVVATLVVGLCVATYLVAGVGTSPLPALALVITGAAVAVTNILSGGMRATGHNAKGAFAQQGYRLLAGFSFIILSVFSVGQWGVVALAVGATFMAAWALRWSFAQPNRWQPSSHEHQLMRRLGLGYSVSLLALSSGDWLDQALVAELSKDLAQVGEYSQAKLLAFYPSLSIGSILGFVALPAIARRRDTLARHDVARWMQLAFVASLVTGVCTVAIAQLVAEPVLGRTLDGHVLLLLGAVGAVRLYYVLPSAVLGAVGTPAALTWLGVCSVAGVVVQVLLTLALAEPAGILAAAATGLLASGLVRSAVGSALSLRHSENHLTSTRTDKGN